MKKYIGLFLIMMMVCCTTLIGCKAGDNENSKVVDYSQYSFTDVSWTRETEHDIETIRFGSDGSFRYSCACGNPVNDADLCEGYTYDDETKTITLNCIETTEEMVTVIKVEKYDEESIQLNFDGEIRIFSR